MFALASLPCLAIVAAIWHGTTRAEGESTTASVALAAGNATLANGLATPVSTNSTTVALSGIACSANLSNLGSFASPSFPDDAPSFANCTYRINATAGQYVWLNVVWIVNASTAKPPAAKLAVFADESRSNSSLILRTPWGYNRTNITIVTGSFAAIEFSSTSSSQAYGFVAEFWSAGCSNTFNKSGWFSSPNYPDPYPANVNCTWTLSASSGSYVQLDLKWRPRGPQTAQSPLPLFYVTYGSSANLSNSLYRISPLALTNLSIFGGDTATVFFSSSRVESYWSFEANFSSIRCEFQKEVGYTINFTSSNYNGSLPPGLICTWRLTSSRTKMAYVYVQYKLSAGSFLGVYDGNSTESEAALIEIAAPKQGDFRQIFGSEAIVLFTTKSVSTDYFVAISHEIDCNYWYPSNSSVSRPYGGERVPGSLKCNWEFQASTDMFYLEITASFYRIPASDTLCPGENITIYETQNTAGTVLWSWNGVSTRAVVIASNTAFVVWQTTCLSNVSSFIINAQEYIRPHVLQSSERAGNGSLRPHNYPFSCPSNERYEWTIAAKSGMSVVLSLDSASASQCGGPDDLHIEGFYTKYNWLLYLDSLCGNGSIVTTPTVKVIFETRNRGQKRLPLRINYTYTDCGGFVLPYQKLSSPIVSTNDQVVKCQWTLMPVTSVGVLTFSQLQFYGQDCANSYLEVYNGVVVQQEALIQRYCSNFTSPRSVYVVGPKSTLILYSNGQGSSPNFTAFFNYVSMPYVYPDSPFTSYNYPYNYPGGSQEVMWMVQAYAGRTFQLTFTVFNISDTNDCIRIQTPTKTSNTTISYCGGCAPQPYNSTVNQVLVFMKADTFISSSGFNATFFSADCHETFSGNGSIHYYNDGIDNTTEVYLICWKIIPEAGKDIAIHVRNYSVGNISTSTFEYGYFSVHGPEVHFQDILGRFYNPAQPPPSPIIGTVQVTVAVTIWSSEIPFVLELDFESQVNRSAIMIGNGSITTPNFPYNYPSSFEYTWKLTANPGQYVFIEFHSFALQAADDNAQCSYDVLHVFSSHQPSALSLLASYCGTSLPPGIYAGYEGTIIFKSNNVTVNAGVNASFTSSSCGGIIVGSGILMSPNYPNLYAGQMLCVWRISTTSASYLLLNFSSIDIENSTECVKDSLKIWTKSSYNNDEETLLDNICGTRGAFIMYAGSSLIIKFQSNNDTSGYGFNVSVVTADPCADAALLDGAWRNVANQQIPLESTPLFKIEPYRWYRFVGLAGNKFADQCPVNKSYTTNGTGCTWYNGEHPLNLFTPAAGKLCTGSDASGNDSQLDDVECCASSTVANALYCPPGYYVYRVPAVNVSTIGNTWCGVDWHTPNSQTTSRTTGYKFIQANTSRLLSYPASSVVGCAAYCTTQYNCTGFSFGKYNPKMTECLLLTNTSQRQLSKHSGFSVYWRQWQFP